MSSNPPLTRLPRQKRRRRLTVGALVTVLFGQLLAGTAVATPAAKTPAPGA